MSFDSEIAAGITYILLRSFHFVRCGGCAQVTISRNACASLAIVQTPVAFAP